MTEVLDKSTAERKLDTDAQAARDESRLAMIAYWLVKYRSFDSKDQKAFEAKFREMFDALESEEAKCVAQAWRDNAQVEQNNRFAPIERRIKQWAQAVSTPAR